MAEQERDVRQVTDSRVLAAMSHPLRRRLLDVLAVYGPQPVGALAERTGQAPGQHQPPHEGDARRATWSRRRPNWPATGANGGGARCQRGAALVRHGLRRRRRRGGRPARRRVAQPRPPGGAGPRLVRRADEEQAVWGEGAFAADRWLRLTPDGVGRAQPRQSSPYSTAGRRRPARRRPTTSRAARLRVRTRRPGDAMTPQPRLPAVLARPDHVQAGQRRQLGGTAAGRGVHLGRQHVPGRAAGRVLLAAVAADRPAGRRLGRPPTPPPTDDHLRPALPRGLRRRPGDLVARHADADPSVRGRAAHRHRRGLLPDRLPGLRCPPCWPRATYPAATPGCRARRRRPRSPDRASPASSPSSPAPSSACSSTRSPSLVSALCLWRIRTPERRDRGAPWRAGRRGGRGSAVRRPRPVPAGADGLRRGEQPRADRLPVRAGGVPGPRRRPHARVPSAGWWR